MSIYLPPELIPLFKYTLGAEWENLDTDAMRSGGHVLGAVASRIRDELTGEMSLAVRNVQRGIEGQANEAFVENMAPYTEREPRYLYSAATQYETLGKFLIDTAAQVEYVQIMIFLQLALLAIQIAWALANSTWTLGGSMIWLAAQWEVTRVLVTNFLGQLVLHILAAEVVSVSLMVAMDQLAQFIQAEILHTRERYDPALTKQAAIAGAIAGALAVPAAGLGHFVGMAGGWGLGKVAAAVKIPPKPVATGVGVLANLGAAGLHGMFTGALLSHSQGQGFHFRPADFTAGVFGLGAVLAGHKLLGFVKPSELPPTAKMVELSKGGPPALPPGKPGSEPPTGGWAVRGLDMATVEERPRGATGSPPVVDRPVAGPPESRSATVDQSGVQSPARAAASGAAVGGPTTEPSTRPGVSSPAAPGSRATPAEAPTAGPGRTAGADATARPPATPAPTTEPQRRSVGGSASAPRGADRPAVTAPEAQAAPGTPTAEPQSRTAAASTGPLEATGRRAGVGNASAEPGERPAGPDRPVTAAPDRRAAPVQASAAEPQAVKSRSVLADPSVEPGTRAAAPAADRGRLVEASAAEPQPRTAAASTGAPKATGDRAGAGSASAEPGGRPGGPDRPVTAVPESRTAADRQAAAAPEAGGHRPVVEHDAASAASSATLVGTDGTYAASSSTVVKGGRSADPWQADQERITHEYSHRMLAEERRASELAAARQDADSALSRGFFSFDEAHDRPLSDGEADAVAHAVLGRLDHEFTMAIGDGRDLVGSKSPDVLGEWEARRQAWRDALPDLVRTEISRHYGTEEMRQAFDRQVAEAGRPRRELLGTEDTGVSDWVRERAYKDFSERVTSAWRRQTGGVVPDGPEQVREGDQWNKRLDGEAARIPDLLERYQRHEFIKQRIDAEFDTVWRERQEVRKQLGLETDSSPYLPHELRDVLDDDDPGGKPAPSRLEDLQPSRPPALNERALRPLAENFFHNRLIADWRDRFGGRPDGAAFSESFGEHLNGVADLIDHVAAREEVVHEAWTRLDDAYSGWSLRFDELSRGDFERVQEEFLDQVRGDYDVAYLGPGSRPLDGSGRAWPGGPDAEFRMRMEERVAGLPDRLDLEFGMAGAVHDGGRRFEALRTDAAVEVGEKVVADLGERFRRDWGTAYHEAHKSDWAQIEDLRGWFEREAATDDRFAAGRQDEVRARNPELPQSVVREGLLRTWRSLLERSADAGTAEAGTAEAGSTASATHHEPEPAPPPPPDSLLLQEQEHAPLSTPDSVGAVSPEARYRARLNHESQVASEVRDSEQAFTRAVEAWRTGGGEMISEAAAAAARAEFAQRARTAATEALGPLSDGVTGPELGAAWQDWRQRSADLLAAAPDLLADHGRQSAALSAVQDRFDAVAEAYHTGHDASLPAAAVEQVRAEFTRAAERAYRSGGWETLPDRIEPMLAAEAELRRGLQAAADHLRPPTAQQDTGQDPAGDPAGVLAHARARLEQQFQTTYRAEFGRGLGIWLSDPATSPAWLEQQRAGWQVVRTELILAQRARIELLEAGWQQVSRQFDTAAADWQTSQPVEQRPSEHSLLTARVETQATLAGLHRQVWGTDGAFDHGRPGRLATITWQQGLQSLADSIPGALEIHRRLQGSLQQADAALDENVQQWQAGHPAAGDLSADTVARVRRQFHHELRTAHERTWRHLRRPGQWSPGAESAEQTWDRQQRQLLAGLSQRFAQETALLARLSRAAAGYRRLEPEAAAAIPAQTRARLAAEYRAGALAAHLADPTAWLAAEQAHENTFGVNLAWATLLRQHQDHADVPASDLSRRDLPYVEVAQQLRVRTGPGSEMTVAALVDPASGRTFLAVDERTPGGDVAQSVTPVPGVDGAYLLLLGQAATLTGPAAASTARQLAQQWALSGGQRTGQRDGRTQVFPGRSDSDARIAEVTDALPRIPGVNLLAVHITPDGHAEIDRSRLTPETEQIIDRAAGHSHPHLTAEEFAAAAVQLPGFDPSLPVVILGCPADSDFTVAFGQKLADLTEPAAGQHTTRELWTAQHYTWHTRDGRLLATTLGLTADGRPQLDRGADDHWVRHRLHTTPAGSRVTRTQHGPDLITALRATNPQLDVQRPPGRLTQDHRWSSDPVADWDDFPLQQALHDAATTAAAAPPAQTRAGTGPRYRLGRGGDPSTGEYLPSEQHLDWLVDGGLIFVQAEAGGNCLFEAMARVAAAELVQAINALVDSLDPDLRDGLRRVTAAELETPSLNTIRVVRQAAARLFLRDYDEHPDQYAVLWIPDAPGTQAQEPDPQGFAEQIRTSGAWDTAYGDRVPEIAARLFGVQLRLVNDDGSSASLGNLPNNEERVLLRVNNPARGAHYLATRPRSTATGPITEATPLDDAIETFPQLVTGFPTLDARVLAARRRRAPVELAVLRNHVQSLIHYVDADPALIARRLGEQPTEEADQRLRLQLVAFGDVYERLDSELPAAERLAHLTPSERQLDALVGRGEIPVPRPRDGNRLFQALLSAADEIRAAINAFVDDPSVAAGLREGLRRVTAEELAAPTWDTIGLVRRALAQMFRHDYGLHPERYGWLWEPGTPGAAARPAAPTLAEAIETNGNWDTNDGDHWPRIAASLFRVRLRLIDDDGHASILGDVPESQDSPERVLLRVRPADFGHYLSTRPRSGATGPITEATPLDEAVATFRRLDDAFYEHVDNRVVGARRSRHPRAPRELTLLSNHVADVMNYVNADPALAAFERGEATERAQARLSLQLIAVGDAHDRLVQEVGGWELLQTALTRYDDAVRNVQFALDDLLEEQRVALRRRLATLQSDREAALRERDVDNLPDSERRRLVARIDLITADVMRSFDEADRLAAAGPVTEPSEPVISIVGAEEAEEERAPTASGGSEVSQLSSISLGMSPSFEPTGPLPASRPAGRRPLSPLPPAPLPSLTLEPLGGPPTSDSAGPSFIPTADEWLGPELPDQQIDGLRNQLDEALAALPAYSGHWSRIWAQLRHQLDLANRAADAAGSDPPLHDRPHRAVIRRRRQLRGLLRTIQLEAGVEPATAPEPVDTPAARAADLAELVDAYRSVVPDASVDAVARGRRTRRDRGRPDRVRRPGPAGVRRPGHTLAAGLARAAARRRAAAWRGRRRAADDRPTQPGDP